MFLNFYEVFLNMGLSGCQNSNFCGQDLMFIFQNLNFTISFSYFFSPGPPWDPRGDSTCDKISSISEIWPALWFFHVFVFRSGVFFHVFSTPGCFFSCFVSPRGVFFMLFFAPGCFRMCFIRIILSNYKIML